MGKANQTIDESTAQGLKVAAGMRVFFTHKSVGANLLNGLEQLTKQAGVTWPVVEIGEQAPPDGAALLHATPGENTDPKSKIDGFAAAIRDQQGTHPQLAFMKLCYVDISPETDVADLLAHYRDTISALRKEFPDITFGHVTTPVTTQASGIKDRINRMLGRRVWDDDANLKRNEYNRILRSEFEGDLILDLERAESTYPDGHREQFEVEGQTGFALVPDYATPDGGHLNPVGQRRVAEELVRFVAAAGKAQK